jgi:hypothetical protein
MKKICQLSLFLAFSLLAILPAKSQSLSGAECIPATNLANGLGGSTPYCFSTQIVSQLIGPPIVYANSTTACTLATNNTGCSGLVTGDCNTFGVFSNGSAITVTVPSTFPVGCSATFLANGAGTLTVSAGSGAAVHTYSSGNATRGQYDMVHAKGINVAGTAVVSLGQ